MLMTSAAWPIEWRAADPPYVDGLQARNRSIDIDEICGYVGDAIGGVRHRPHPGPGPGPGLQIAPQRAHILKTQLYARAFFADVEIGASALVEDHDGRAHFERLTQKPRFGRGR